MNQLVSTRRALILSAASAGLAAFGHRAKSANEPEMGVTANEDLMREHGIIRRALFVYAEVARRARRDASSIPMPDLLDTARLFRRFAEDYHERGLEETHIFPLVRKLTVPAAKLPDVLLAQHQRGREITDYLLRVAARGRLAASETEVLASTLDAFVAMYGPHAAWEDTVLFPARKAALGRHAYTEMGEKFEDLETAMFGHDGFQDALTRIERIERAFGLGELARFTAPPPPGM